MQTIDIAKKIKPDHRTIKRFLKNSTAKRVSLSSLIKGLKKLWQRNKWDESGGNWWGSLVWPVHAFLRMLLQCWCRWNTKIDSMLDPPGDGNHKFDHLFGWKTDRTMWNGLGYIWNKTFNQLYPTMSAAHHWMVQMGGVLDGLSGACQSQKEWGTNKVVEVLCFGPELSKMSLRGQMASKWHPQYNVCRVSQGELHPLAEKEEPCLQDENGIYAWQCPIACSKEYKWVPEQNGYKKKVMIWRLHHPILTPLKICGASWTGRSIKFFIK